MDAHEAMENMILQQRRLDEASKQNANNMAELLVPHLKRVGNGNLSRLKKALAKYNIHTGRWSD